MIGSEIGGRYRIESVLGEGGYGVVYKAHQISTGQTVAVKLLLPEKMQVAQASTEIERFKREMRTIAQLKHPNIVRLIDTGQLDNGALFTVLEYVEGETLASLVRREGGLHPREARYLMMQVLDAISCAHERGIIHRDLKPANIMVAATGARRNALVLDFGIAAIASDHQGQDYVALTGVGHINGTPAYMAPEQFGTMPATPQADIYSWGLVFLEALTGMRSVGGNSLGEIVMQHMSAEPISIPHAYLQHPLGYVLRHATAKDLRERYPTARQALADLERCDVADLPRLRGVAGGSPPMKTGHPQVGGSTGQFGPGSHGHPGHPQQTPSGNYAWPSSGGQSAAWPAADSPSAIYPSGGPRSQIYEAPSGLHSTPNSAIYGVGPSSAYNPVLPEAPVQAGRGGRKNLVVMLVLAALIVVGGAAAAILFTLKSSKDKDGSDQAAASESPSGSGEGRDDDDDEGESGSDEGAQPSGDDPAGGEAVALRAAGNPPEADSAPEVPWSLVEVPAASVMLGLDAGALEELQGAFPDNVFDLSYETGVQKPRAFERPELTVMVHEVSGADWLHVVPDPSIDSICSDAAPTPQDLDAPLVQIGAAEADAFCVKIGMRLPNADEWEALVRGSAGRAYGFEGPLTSARTEELASSPTAARAWNQVEGIVGLSGGVREWVRCSRAEHGAYCVDGFGHRGGSFMSGAFWMHAAVMGLNIDEPACHRAPDIGFRCVR